MGGASNGQVLRRAREDMAEHPDPGSLPSLIGQSVALHLAQVLPSILQQGISQPECWFCIQRTIGLIRAYRVAVVNAQKAGEPVPDRPQPEVRRSVTLTPIVQLANGPAGPMPIGASVPSCFECLLDPPQPEGGQPVTVGLVDVAGRPISFRRTG